VAKRIIVADDSTTVQRVIKLILSPKGYEVESCESGKKAIEAIKNGLPDIIFADAVMKNTNGLELAATLKKKTPELSAIPVVVLVNSFDDIKDEDIKKCGAVAKLIKPFDDSQLINAVEKYSSKVDSSDVADMGEVELGAEKSEWNMESFERPKVPDFDDPMKTVKYYGDEENLDTNLDIKVEDIQPSHQVDDEFFTIAEDEIIKELGVPDHSSYKEDRDKTNSFPSSEETLSEEESQRLLEEFRLMENKDGTIKFDEDKTPISGITTNEKKSPIEKIQAEPDMGLWSSKTYSDSVASPAQEQAPAPMFGFDDLTDLPDLEKELCNQDVKKMTKEAVDKMVRELLPEIAEKVIREEIAKIIGRE